MNSKPYKIIKNILFIFCLLFSSNIFSFDKIYDLNNTEEATISISPKYFTYHDSKTLNENNIFLKVKKYPIIKFNNNKKLDLEVLSKNKKINITAHKSDENLYETNLEKLIKINKKDYYEYIKNSFFTSSNFAFVNCHKCFIDNDSIFFHSQDGQYTIQYHNLLNNHKFYSNYNHTIKLKFDKENFKKLIEVNVKVLYGNNFNQTKILKFFNIKEDNDGDLSFDINDSDLRNSKFFKISTIYVNIRNLNVINSPININFKKLEIHQELHVTKNNESINVKTSNDYINLNTIFDNNLDDDSTFRLVRFTSPIEIISDDKKYIEKNKIYDFELINYYSDSIDEIFNGNKLVLYNKDKLSIQLSGSPLERIHFFSENFELSKKNNFLKIISPINFFIKKIEINTKENKKSNLIITENYLTGSLISLGKSEYIESIRLISDDESLTNNSIEFELINTELIDSNKKKVLSNENIRNATLKKIDFLKNSFFNKSFELKSNQITALTNSLITLKEIKNNYLFDVNISCNKPSEKNLKYYVLINYFDNQTLNINSYLKEIDNSSIIKSSDIREIINENKFYGLYYAVANFSNIDINLSCLIDHTIFNSKSNNIKKLDFTNTRKIFIDKHDFFLPGYIEIIDENDLFDYQVTNFISTPHESKLPKIVFSHFLSKVIFLLLFIGFLFLINNLIINDKRNLNRANRNFFLRLNRNIQSMKSYILIIILFLSFFIFQDEIYALIAISKNHFSLLFIFLYIPVFYILFIDSSLIKSYLIKFLALSMLIFLSYKISSDSYTYISILIFAFFYQELKKVYIKFCNRFNKKYFDPAIFTYSFIAIISLLITVFVNFFINIKYCDYFVVYAYYSIVMIFVYKFFILKK